MDNYYEPCWNLYKDMIPHEQRRSLDTCISLLTRRDFSLVPLSDEADNFLGFYNIWEFESFLYVEQFAIKSEYQGKGHGKKAVLDMLSRQELPVILAVDRPEDMASRKSAAFFEKMGFVLNPYEYIQPPLDEGKPVQKKFLMSYPVRLHLDDFKYIRDELYNTVYSAAVSV